MGSEMCIRDRGDPDDVDSTPGNENPDEDDQDDVSVDVNLFSTIGDFVWNDTNGDGIQDSNESGIPGVTVILYDTNDEIVAVVVTDSDGAYSFDDVEARDYYIVFENIDDEFIVSPTGSGNDANDRQRRLCRVWSDILPRTQQLGKCYSAGSDNLHDVDNLALNFRGAKRRHRSLIHI